MNPLRQLVKNLEGFVEYNRSQRGERLLLAATDANALMKSRVINDRVNDKGNSFGEYALSTQAIKVRKGRTKGTNNPLLFDSGFSSKTFPNKNFSDTNRMWNQVLPTLVSDSGDTVVVKIEPNGDRKKIMEIQEAKHGVILALSENEEDFVAEVLDGYTEDDLRQFKLL